MVELLSTHDMTVADVAETLSRSKAWVSMRLGLLKEMGTGVVVAGVLGAHSGNILNGDYSIGLSPGLWVENGEIAGRVKDAMVAGNVYEDLKNVVALGDRQHAGFMGRFPALLLDGVSFATRG